jgi:hypothetical protein
LSKRSNCKKKEWIPAERVPVMPTQFQSENVLLRVMLLRFNKLMEMFEQLAVTHKRNL